MNPEQSCPKAGASHAMVLARERRRQAAEQDAQILRENGSSDDDLDDLVQWSGSHLRVED